MKNDEEFFEEGKKGEEDLLDFEFDELPEEGSQRASGDPASDGKIIELVDIVDDSEFDEIARLLDEEEPIGDKNEAKESESYFALVDEQAEIILFESCHLTYFKGVERASRRYPEFPGRQGRIPAAGHEWDHCHGGRHSGVVETILGKARQVGKNIHDNRRYVRYGKRNGWKVWHRLLYTPEKKI